MIPVPIPEWPRVGNSFPFHPTANTTLRIILTYFYFLVQFTLTIGAALLLAGVILCCAKVHPNPVRARLFFTTSNL